MMADIRMLQEQNQLLQQQLAAITDALKGLNAKLDEQANVARRSFADHKLLVDNISSDLRVVREKVDDNNVRISSLSQDLEAMRSGAAPAVASPGGDQQPPAAGGNPAAGWESRGRREPGHACEPGRVAAAALRVAALADYMGAQYDLAVQRVRQLHQVVPRSRDQAGEALFFIGETYFAQGKYRDAVTAYERSIAEYPNRPEDPRGVLQARGSRSTRSARSTARARAGSTC